jgi:hypothetical protein
MRAAWNLVFGTAAAMAAFSADAAAAGIPDFSGPWGRDVLYFEPPLSGPGPVVNRSRRPNGSMDGSALFGDFTNPILKPASAEVLKKFGAISLTGAAFANPHNQCRPEPVPFTLAIQFAVQIVQQKDEVDLLYLGDHKVRHIRMNASHPAHVVPTWQGDSIGHYEGDALVIDTVGIKTGPLSMVDQFGTPYSEALHVTERYRLIDGESARVAQVNHTRIHPEAIPYPYGRGPIDQDATKKGLQVEITVEDPGAFTEPWSALVTYRHVLGEWPEAVCAENFHEYYANRDTDVPQADKADF